MWSFTLLFFSPSSRRSSGGARRLPRVKAEAQNQPINWQRPSQPFPLRSTFKPQFHQNTASTLPRECAHALTRCPDVLGNADLQHKESSMMTGRLPSRLLLWFIGLLGIALLTLFVVCVTLQIQVPWQGMSLQNFQSKHFR